MARRKSSKKIQPVPLKLVFRIPPAALGSTDYIDISQCVSAVSRKFFRQGLNWAVAGGRVLMPPASTSSAGNSVYLSTLQHSWTVSNSWHKSFAVWNKLNQKSMSEAESIRPKFYDFKIYADSDHVLATSANNLLPVQLGPGNTIGPFASAVVTTNEVTPGEWDYSNIVIPDTLNPAQVVTYKLMMHGDPTLPALAGGTKGIIDGYESSRSVPQSPDPEVPADLSTNWMAAVFNEGTYQTSAVLQDLEDENDELPYDQLNYPGGPQNYSQMENQGFVFNTNTIGVTEYKFSGFTAPCGLIRVDQLFSDESASYDMILELDLMPGHHRGYMAEPMTEM